MKKVISFAIVFLMILQMFSLTALAEATPQAVLDAKDSVVKFQADHCVAVDYHGKGYDELGYIQLITDGENYYYAINAPESLVAMELTYVGTGFAIGKEGEQVDTIATAAHVMNEETLKAVLYYDDEEDDFFIIEDLKIRPTRFSCVFGTDVQVEAELLSKSDAYDFAVFKLKSPINRTPMALNTGDHVPVGETVYSIGFPVAAENGLVDTYTSADALARGGNVSKYGSLVVLNSNKPADGYSSEATITGGNSGGPLVDAKGVCVGINLQGKDEEQINEAVDIKYLVTVLNELGIGFIDGSAKNGFGVLLPIILVVLGVAVLAAIVFAVLKFGKKKAKVPAGATSSAGFFNPVTKPSTICGETTVLSSAPTSTLNSVHLTRKSNGEVIALRGEEFSVGREPGTANYVISGNGKISRKHATFFLSDGAWCVMNNSASNGTFINGTKIEVGQAYYVNDGDIVRLADEDFEFKLS